MTAITATIRQPHRLSTWAIAFLVMLVAGLTAALVVSLTSSDTTSAPAQQAPAQQQVSVGTNAPQPGAGRLCTGSVKDWTC